MDEQAINRILDSYERVAPGMEGMVVDFYDRLFEVCPEARPMFRKDMTMQRQHLAATLALLVRNLRFQDVLEDAVMDLGAAHVKVGVKPEQYPIVRDALLWSLGKAMGSGWTAELEADWKGLLDHIIALMLKGATHFAMKAVRGEVATGGAAKDQ